MEAAADCSRMCGSPACWALVPLEHREAVLVVHEVTDRVSEGNVKGRLGGTTTCHGKHNRRRLGKGFVPCAVSIMDAGLCSRLSGTSCGRLWSGLWGSLGGGRYESAWLWLDKDDCPVRWKRNAWSHVNLQWGSGKSWVSA